MSLIEGTILRIVVPFSSGRFAIRVYEDISRFSHISIKCLHNGRLLKVGSKLIIAHEKLSVREYLKGYSGKYISIDLASEIFLGRSHRHDIRNARLFRKMIYAISVAFRLDPMNIISCRLGIREERLSDGIFRYQTSDIEYQVSLGRRDTRPSKQDKKYIGHTRFDIPDIALVIEYPLSFFHRAGWVKK